MVESLGWDSLHHRRLLSQGTMFYTPYSKMAAARNDLGRAARKRGIEGRRENLVVFTYGNRERSCFKIALFHSVLRKFMWKNGVKISYQKFPEDRRVVCSSRMDCCHTKGSWINFKWQNTRSRVCLRHFKSSGYICSFAGREKTLKTTAVPSAFPWKKCSLVKRKAPKHSSPIKRKRLRKTSATPDLLSSTKTSWFRYFCW